jgi:biotin synthase-like enzyme
LYIGHDRETTSRTTQKRLVLHHINHNIDTSREYYPTIITTRSYDDRLQTPQHVREAGISICLGNILNTSAVWLFPQ